MNYKKILFVHEGRPALDRLSRTMRNVGHTVSVSHDSARALELIEIEHPSIIVTSDDVKDPDVFDLCVKIKQTAANGTKLMVVARKGTRETHRRSLDSGADDYVTEASTLPTLVARINALLYEKETAPGDQAGGLKGTTSQSGLIDILQLIEFSAKSGELTVNQDGQQGTMLFFSGHLVQAWTDDKQDESAVHEMLSWSSGEFSFVAKDIERSETTLTPISTLVLEWAKSHDEGEDLLDTTSPSVDAGKKSEDDESGNWASDLNSWLGYLREK